MEFRRSGQLEERRRRVLMDEIASPSEADNTDPAAGAGSSAKGPVRAYSPAVLAERQPRVTDLLPVRPFSVALLLLLGLTGIAAVQAIHVHVAPLPLTEQSLLLTALDAQEPGGVAGCYSSMLLAAASLAALLIFGIRSHRVDDYRGRYRVWLWTAAGAAWLSLDAATAIHNALGLAVTLGAGKLPLGAFQPTIATAWIAVYGLFFAPLAIRLALEVRSSLTSLFLLLGTAALYVVGAVLQLQLLTISSIPLVAEVVESSLLMLAHLGLLATFGWYARHVYLDAQGRLKVHIDPDRKRGKSRNLGKLKIVAAEKAAKQAEQRESGPAKVAAAAGKPAEGIKFGTSASSSISSASKAGATITKSNLSTAQADDDDDEEDEYENDGLSKSERRRLKKLARREQQRRAA